jgi:hypothetical protein
MNLVAFQSLRRGLQLNAAPATSQVRAVCEAALRAELLATGVFTDLEVGSTSAADHLLVVLGGFRADVSEDEVARAVQYAWSAVAFHHWQSHAFLTEDGHVEMQAATLDRPGGRYLTLHLVVERSAAPVVPQQRAEAAPMPALALA